MSEARWKRPESVPYPSVWRRFDGRTPIGPNNVIPKFRIQDSSEEWWEVIVQHMVTHFLRDEPSCARSKVRYDPQSVEDLKEAWRKVLRQKLGLACIVENWEELGDPSLPKLAGCNNTHAVYKGVNDSLPKGKAARHFFKFMDLVHSQVNCFERYRVTEYMYGLGLSVDPIYRGQGIGIQLLNSRYDLGRAVGLKYTVTVFTPITSQTLAERAGFETIAEVNYDDIVIDGEALFKGLMPKTAKLMVAKLQ